MMMASNRDVVVKFIHALSNGDSRAADECITGDAISTTKGHSKLSGQTDHDAIVGLIGALKEIVPTGLGLKIGNVIADGNHAAVEFEGDGVTRDGTPYRNQYCMTFELEGGRIRRINEYLCTAHAEEVLLPLLSGVKEELGI